jgi:hypothetical protein
MRTGRYVRNSVRSHRGGPVKTTDVRLPFGRSIECSGFSVWSYPRPGTGRDRPLALSKWATNNAEFIGGGGLLTHIRVVPGSPLGTVVPKRQHQPCPPLRPFIWSTAGQYRSGGAGLFRPQTVGFARRGE